MQSAEYTWGAEPEWVPEQTVEIPLCGVVAAGEPYRAFELDETLSVPAGLWNQQRVFALRVRGSSMVDEGIRDGDYLILEPREEARDGQPVVAESDGCVPVKKPYRGPGGRIRRRLSPPWRLRIRPSAGAGALRPQSRDRCRWRSPARSRPPGATAALRCSPCRRRSPALAAVAPARAAPA